MSDVHGPILSVGRFAEMHDNRAVGFTNMHAVSRFESRTRTDTDEERIDVAYSNPR